MATSKSLITHMQNLVWCVPHSEQTERNAPINKIPLPLQTRSPHVSDQKCCTSNH